VFEFVGELLPRFLSFVWFLASALEAVEEEVTPDAVIAGLTSTLGWKQIDDALQARWTAAARAAVEKYLHSEPGERRRWSSVTAALGTARRLDLFAAEVEAALPTGTTYSSAVESLGILLDGDRLAYLRELPEAPARLVYNRRAGARQMLDIPLQDLFRDWVMGAELTMLADTYLSGVSSPEFQYEQLGDLLNDYCETFLPWVIGTVAGWVNRRREEKDQPAPFPRELPAYLRYGVSSPVALQLALGGVRSRRMCMAVSAAFAEHQAANGAATVRPWLAAMTVADWRQRFSATPAELRSLVEYARPASSGVSEALLTGATAEWSLAPRVSEHPRSAAEIRRASEEEIAEVDVWCGDQLVGAIPAHSWPDVQVLLNSGIAFAAEAEVTASTATLWLRPEVLADEADE